jgi:hypothetical protein
MGWKTGFEPATSAATERRSTIELHPPRRNCETLRPDPSDRGLRFLRCSSQKICSRPDSIGTATQIFCSF